MCLGASLWFLVVLDVFWNFWAFLRDSWWFLVFFVVLGGSWWFLVVLGGSLWLSLAYVVLGGTWWLLLILGCFWLFFDVCGGSW